MKNLKLKIALVVLPLLIISACNLQIIARLAGTLGTSGLYVDIGFTNLSSSPSGTGSSSRLAITFSNGSSEYFTMTLAPLNSSGTTLAQLFPSGTYTVDGTDTKLESQIYTANGTESLTATAGQIQITQIAFSSGDSILTIAGTYAVSLEGGGAVAGQFAYSLEQ